MKFLRQLTKNKMLCCFWVLAGRVQESGAQNACMKKKSSLKSLWPWVSTLRISLGSLWFLAIVICWPLMTALRTCMVVSQSSNVHLLTAHQRASGQAGITLSRRAEANTVLSKSRRSPLVNSVYSLRVSRWTKNLWVMRFAVVNLPSESILPCSQKTKSMFGSGMICSLPNVSNLSDLLIIWSTI